MKTVSIKVYELDELDEEAKEKAIDKIRDKYYEWELEGQIDFMVDNVLEAMRQLGLNDVEWGDLTYETGRRAKAGINAGAFSVSVMGIFPEITEINIIPKKIGVWFSEFPTLGWEHTEDDAIKYIEFEEGVPEKKQKEIWAKVSKLLYDVVEIMQKFIKDLESVEADIWDSDYWEQYIKDNGYMFFADGRIFDE